MNPVIENKRYLRPGSDVEVVVGHAIKILQDHRIDFYPIHPVEQKRRRPRRCAAAHSQDQRPIRSRRKQRGKSADDLFRR